jgi:hypothetical protein
MTLREAVIEHSSSSIVNRHPSKKVITSGVIATALRHHNVLCHPASLVKII